MKRAMQQSVEENPAGTPDGPEFPVAVIMEREAVENHRWMTSRTRAVGVVASDEAAGCRLLRDDGRVAQHLWTGLRLRLHADELEGYYQNLRGEQPGLFVVCQGEEGGELEPVLVTASYGDAGSHLEVDEQVFNVPMPPEIYLWLERYVVENYAPRPVVKRRRKRWYQEGREQ